MLLLKVKKNPNFLFKTLLIGYLTFSVISSSALADENAPIFALGPKISTLGAGLELSIKGLDCLNFRMNANGFKYSKDFVHQTVPWKGQLGLLNMGAIVDYHPFLNGFRLSTGAYYNGNRIYLSTTPKQPFTIAKHTYTPEQVGTAKGKLHFRKIAPYVGFGYDSALLDPNDDISFNIDVGLLFQGAPKGSFKATGLLGKNPQLLADLKKNAEQTVNKRWVRCYPVVGVGIKYHF